MLRKSWAEQENVIGELLSGKDVLSVSPIATAVLVELTNSKLARN